MSRLALYLLGPPRLERGPPGGEGVPLELQYQKNVALLAYLAVTGRSHSRESLITLLWPELEPSRARANLRRNLSLLRKALDGEWLVVDGETIALDPDAGAWVDVDQFRQRLAACETHGHPATEVCPDCILLLEETAALYRDHFLAGFSLRDSAAFDEFQFFQTEGLKDELASALQRLVRGHSAHEAYELAIPHARRWLALDPLHEPAHRHLMLLYTKSGQRAAALRQYAECERLLEEELGMPVEEETTRVYRAIKEWRELPSLAAAIPRPGAARKQNLPLQTTPFVGREAELTELARMLSDPDVRLLTVIGPGGSGKTRLALEAAAQAGSFDDGVYFVSLAPLRSSEAIVPTMAEALGFSFYGSGDPREQLLRYLREKRMFIIMDNYEHLLPPSVPPAGGEGGGGADLVSDVLKTAPGVKILATSRAGLNVQGECRFHIAGMDVPEPVPRASGESPPDLLEYSAIKLFVQSARRVRRGFDCRTEDLAHVACICRLVEGMPLSILLAAAWVDVLTPEEIATEISGKIGQGLDLLETDLRDVPERQRSVRAVFDHSWRLLTERERTVFRALAVFRGGFTREAARAVAGASLRELRALVDKSLLQRTSASRYEVHELLRQYAEEKLDRDPAASWAARDRHCTYYAAALQRWCEELEDPRQVAAIAEMDAEIENARAAWDWAVAQGQVERLDQATEGLHEFYAWRWRIQEAEAAFRAAAERLTAALFGEGPVLSVDGVRRAERLRVLAKILAKQAMHSHNLGRSDLRDQLLRRSLAILEGPELAGQDTRRERAYVLRWMGRATSDLEEARRFEGQSLALYRALGDRRWAALQLVEIAKLDIGSGDCDEAKRLCEESLALGRALGDRVVIATALSLLGDIARRLGRLEEAEGLLRECLVVSRETGSPAGWPAGVADICFSLSSALACLGKFAEAHSLAEEGLAIYNELGASAWWNITVGCTKVHLGQYAQARARAEMDLPFFQESGRQWGVASSLFVQGQVALAEEAYAEARRLLQESAAVPPVERLLDEPGQALAVVGYAARGLGQFSQARRYFCEALRIAADIGTFMPRILALPGIALLLADRGEAERAVELYALASRYPFVANSRWFEDVAGKRIEAIAAALPPEVVAMAQARGRARDLDATAAELLDELAEGV